MVLCSTFFGQDPFHLLDTSLAVSYAPQIVLNTTSAMIRTRLTVLFLTTAWLALAGLSSAISHFANILQDRAKSDLANTNASILDITFENLMKNVLEGMVVVALLSALFDIFGIILVIYPSWLQENCESGLDYGCIQVVLSLVVVCVGGYFASRVHGYQTSFEYFDRAGQFHTTRSCIMELSAKPRSDL
ncbi:uncharacterized protein N7498_001734 [Penicillium cinerascens]|uniref:Uncharacterized protein n=1 Tax=Penicillium cinerascens TaxID=70096 RepID=A0A9W9TA86_9EURO|nr:uncharacterized protein N7498_001734 [Penicillium cinerascens]KAJ5215327.1 hypothetical protein N7498_001734 [Penicillium cinerascens]